MPELLGCFPRLFPKPAPSIAEIGRRIREGSTTCGELLRACLDQVEEWEPKVHAWVVLDSEGALEQAKALDHELKTGRDRGPLHGIPIAIKDIIDVAGLPTACGARRWADRVAIKDADVVASLRKAGAVIMGKTVTTPHAWIDTPVTRNPWNLERSPGGSSSGSAAAVACGMCLGAIGTQTGGSITRPASFCGVGGMKPSQIFMSMSGVYPFSHSLDHVGPIAPAVADLKVIFTSIRASSVPPKSQSSASGSPPRLGRMRGFFDRRADPAARSAFDEAVTVLEGSGATIVHLDDPVDFEQVLKDHRCVMAVESAVAHSDWLDANPDDYPPRIRELITEGRFLSALEYVKAKDRMGPTQAIVMQAFVTKKLDALITPATVGTATEPATTGDPAFNSPWSYTGLPTISFPTGLASDGLPVAAQLSGSLADDDPLIDVAEWCEQAIRSRRQRSPHAPREGDSSRGA
jgi:aspartyl-tRNA(Asn)/glutamyl-tRNA(Gln) amidotransferase subunit A